MLNDGQSQLSSLKASFGIQRTMSDDNPLKRKYVEFELEPNERALPMQEDAFQAADFVVPVEEPVKRAKVSKVGLSSMSSPVLS